MLNELWVTAADVTDKARSVEDFEFLFVHLAAGGLFNHVFTYTENRQTLMSSIPLVSVLRKECYGMWVSASNKFGLWFVEGGGSANLAWDGNGGPRLHFFNSRFKVACSKYLTSRLQKTCSRLTFRWAAAICNLGGFEITNIVPMCSTRCYRSCS